MKAPSPTAPVSAPARGVWPSAIAALQSALGSTSQSPAATPELAATPEPAVTKSSLPPSSSTRVVDAGETARRLPTAYLAGQRSSWMPYDVPVDGPLVVRAAGQISIGNDTSSPNGVAVTSFANHPNARVLPSAPALALIGRFCSDDVCSEPFFIGSQGVLCPSNRSPAELQLWTNQEIRLDGVSTLRRYSGTVGGFTVAVSHGSDQACGARASRVSDAATAPALETGQILRGSELRVSSSQAWWKPFFVPLEEPLKIRAWGSIQGRGHRSTDPDGLAANGEAASGSGPALDGGRTLAVPTLPYQALIGRLCGPEQCGPVFFVGSEKTICPAPGLDDRLELWINNVVSARGRLGGTLLPVTSDVFEWQARHGAYEFEVSRASDGACRLAANQR